MGGRRRLKRMANRMAKRAGIQGEEGVAVAFGYRSLWASVLIGILEAASERIPFLPLLITLLTFPLHRIALVTDQHAYVFRGRPFHRPGKKLGEYPIAPDSAHLGHGIFSRGRATFPDGQKVWHSLFFRWRIVAVKKAANGER